jgi:5-methylcytosine-specific restriction endonuclease McrA
MDKFRNGDFLMETKTCTKCHTEKSVSQFYVARGKYVSACKECKTLQGKQYYIDNKETVKVKRAAYQKAHRAEQYVHTQAWRKRNVEKMREAGRRQYANNIEHHTAVKNAWRKANVEKIKAVHERYRVQHLPKMAEKAHKYRARKRSNGVYQVSEKELIKLYSSPCIACGTTERVTVDHIIPIVRGGRHSIGNLQPLCLSCNSSKNAKTMAEWKYFLNTERTSNVALCQG